MMYDKNSKFVIAIAHKGKILREIDNQVFMPFDSEYSIRIKNPHITERVAVEVSIDGTTITGSMIVIDANSSFDLKRMLVDGDLQKGPKLKFISKEGNKEGEQLMDPSNAANGLVQVRFFQEFNPYPNTWLYNKSIQNTDNINYTYIYDDHTSTGENHLEHATITTSSNVICNNNIDASQIGGTVAGRTTTQRFEITDFTPCALPVATLSLWIRCKKNPVLVKDTKKKFCSNCGKKSKRFANFCQNCGTGL